MKKRRIVIASVLKPVDDTRMYEKMAMTLSDSGKYEVFIVGFPSKDRPDHPNIRLLPLEPFSRISLRRLLAPFRIQKILHQVQPELLIVNTHELLIVALLNRILFGVKIVYDVRENYYRNILYTATFPLILRPFIAGWVRLKEKLCSPLIHRFILAEAGYSKEIGFFGSRAIIIENKVKMPQAFTRISQPGQKRLLFSGTLAESTGVFLAIDLARKLHLADPEIRLTVIGFCARPSELKRLCAEVEKQDFIELIGGGQLVPHHGIMSAIAKSDFGLLAYPASFHTQNAIPTKLYEYLACGLPVILQRHEVLEELCAPYDACVAIDYATAEASQLLARMKSRFYSSPPKDVTWDSEGKKLLDTLEGI